MEDSGTDMGASPLTPAGYRSRVAEANAARALRTARALLIDGYAYERPDGVSVVPLFTLGP